MPDATNSERKDEGEDVPNMMDGEERFVRKIGTPKRLGLLALVCGSRSPLLFGVAFLSHDRYVTVATCSKPEVDLRWPNTLDAT